jgi:predicted Zn finger-like uncharacterized protein
MIIECQACHARFRLDESRIKGKGARVRCRKCGESILVMKDGPEGISLEPPAPGGFDINLAVGGSLDAEPSPPPPAVEAAPPEIPAPDAFDINLAVGGPAPEDDFLELGAVAPPPSPPPEAPVEILSAEPLPDVPEPPAEPVYETGVDPFAAAPQAGFEPVPEPPRILLTETPFDLADEPAAAPPVAPAAEPDDVDLAFEQFLATGDGEPQAAAPPAEPVFEPVLEPAGPPAFGTPADDFLDLSESPAATAAPEPAPGERHEPAPFLLSDTDTLDFLGAEQAPAPEPPPPARPAVTPDPFAFQLDEESMHVPERPAEPFIHAATPDPFGSAAIEAPSERPQRQQLPQEVPVPKTALRARPDKPSGGGPTVRPGVAILVLLFLVIAGGGGYLAFTNEGRSTLKSLVPGVGALLGEDNAARKSGPQFDIRNPIGYYDNTAKAGRMFVLKGQVANIGPATRGRIRLHAALLDNTGKMLVEKTVYAGNVLGGEALRVADRETIEKTLSSPFGEKLANLDVAPGKSVPFMVVFLDIPEGIDTYMLEAKEGE